MASKKLCLYFSFSPVSATVLPGKQPSSGELMRVSSGGGWGSGTQQRMGSIQSLRAGSCDHVGWKQQRERDGKTTARHPGSGEEVPQAPSDPPSNGLLVSPIG